MSEHLDAPPQASVTINRWRGSKVVLGLMLLGAGVFVLADISLVATVSYVLIGVVAILAGVFQIAHALLLPTWSSLAGRTIGGILYAAFGLLLVQRAEFGIAFLTLALSIALVVSGIVRIVVALRQGSAYRWLLVSGFVGITAGLAIFLADSGDTARLIALLFGADLLVHGIGWLVVAARERRAPS